MPLGLQSRTNMIMCTCVSMIDAAHLVKRFFSAGPKFFSSLGRGQVLQSRVCFPPARNVARKRAKRKLAYDPGNGGGYLKPRSEWAMLGLLVATT